MKNILILIALFLTLQVTAQNTNPIKWEFFPKKEANGTTTLLAKATIEKGWHVFAPNPGGDGLLIPTGVVLNEKGIANVSPAVVEGKEISKEMDGVGLVHYFEYQVVYKINFEAKGQTSVSGTVSYQLCNDQLCFPPTDLPFEIKL
ncbi:MAG: hypothetical protein JNJ58_08840 [Chitinophagaceae bacterium]|nr:hypothetical protein [Chitinophagaceae bacterium]